MTIAMRVPPQTKFSSRGLVVGAGLCALAIFAGGAASAETLQQALRDAYRYNPALDSQRAQQRATDEQVPIALGGYRPSVDATADVGYTNRRVRPDGGGAGGETHPRGWSVTGTQPVFDGFQTLNAVRAAEAQVRGGRATLRAVETQVLLDAVTAYIDVVRDQAIVRLQENNVVVLTRELKATQDRFAVGEVTRTDVAQAQARRAAAVSQLDSARGNLKISRATYERVIGHPPSNLEIPPTPEALLPKTLQDAVAVGIQENPNVIAALYAEQQARHTVDQIWGRLLPQANIDATYSQRFGDAQGIEQVDTTNVTGRLTWQLYDAGINQAQVRQAKQTHIARLQDIEDFRAQATANVVSAWSQLQAARAQLVSDMAQVEANQIALTGVREEERVGQRTVLDVLNAELELVTSQVNLVTTRRNVLFSAFGTLAAMGRLTAERLALATDVYDPEAHYFEVRRKWGGVNITHQDGRREFLNTWETQVVPTSPSPPPGKPIK
jgi:outer membrane protein